MITLHGKYDNGNITIAETNLPKLKADVIIQIFDKNDSRNNEFLGTYKLKGILDKKNIRDFAHD